MQLVWNGIIQFEQEEKLLVIVVEVDEVDVVSAVAVVAVEGVVAEEVQMDLSLAGGAAMQLEALLHCCWDVFWISEQQTSSCFFCSSLSCCSVDGERCNSRTLTVNA